MNPNNGIEKIDLFFHSEMIPRRNLYTEFRSIIDSNLILMLNRQINQGWSRVSVNFLSIINRSIKIIRNRL